MSKRTIFEMINRAAEKYADKTYLSQKDDYGWVSTTFSQAREKALELASALIETGMVYQDKIAILSEAKADWIISEFGALYSGATMVPLSIKLLPEEIPFRINHSDTKLFFISENTLEKVISHFDKYEYKFLKLVVLDQPSEKIKRLCKKYNFDEKKLIYIEDLYKLGKDNFDKNLPKIKDIEKNISEDDVVTISYTSGTTGNPKGIMLTHLNYYSNSHEAVNTFKIKENISTLIILPTDHSFAHTVGIYTGLVKGLSLYFVDARGGGMNALKNIPKNLVEANPHFLLTVPALTSNFINKIKEGVQAKGSMIEGIFNRGLEAAIRRNGDGYTKPENSVRIATYLPYILAEKLIFKKLRQIWGKNIEFFVGGGALLDIKQQQFYTAIGVPVYQGYGLTEATPIISTNTPFQYKMGTSGKVLGGMTCKICDENGVEVKKGERGEIVIQGDNVMKGYYKNPAATEKTLKEGWLYTGDLGYFDQDDFLVVVGRSKALLISEDGEKYSPEEIEEAIVNSSELIHQVMIYNDHNKFTTALITLEEAKVKQWIKKQGNPNPEKLLGELGKELLLFRQQPEFKGKFPSKWIPSHFQVIEDVFSEENHLINSTLKMVRHKITEQYKDRIELMYNDSAQDAPKKKNLEILSKKFF
ncbi:MAG: AMP-dependent synthetase [Flavobacteriia bacterium]|nr:MAG: AMP-dependent synthetase [Flavobacteriia bacterium]